jgi:SAM-dependent methyltransferase
MLQQKTDEDAAIKTTGLIECAVPGTHRAFLSFLLPYIKNRVTDILDIGAGRGNLSKLLAERGLEVTACDLYPDDFLVSDVECLYADLNDNLPFAGASFDGAVAVEVMEHLAHAEKLISECSRVIRPGGILAITTPNIVSLKSRIRFLITGFYYSFKPLDARDVSGWQHVNPMTPDRYRYIAELNGFRLIGIGTDRYQNSSVALLILWPIMKLLSFPQKVRFNVHNTLTLLLGRSLFLVFERT